MQNFLFSQWALVAHFQIFRRLMKEKFDAYLCSVTFGKKVPNLSSRLLVTLLYFVVVFLKFRQPCFLKGLLSKPSGKLMVTLLKLVVLDY